MQITPLAAHPEFIPQLAGWQHAQWSRLHPHRTLEMRLERLRSHLTEALLPTTLIAVDDGQLLGSASLVERDLADRPELSPCLASVYVAPEYRRRGAGRALVRGVMELARQAGVKNLYLYTLDRRTFYEHLGWQVLEHSFTASGRPMVIMECELKDEGESG